MDTLYSKDRPQVKGVKDGQLVIVENTNELLIRVRDKLMKVATVSEV